MATSPLVSVIIPSYNRSTLLPRAIKSVLDQTFSDLEVIVVDDASTDDTRQSVENLKDSRIRYVRHNINKGVNAARNTGIQSALGEFVAFLDSDDEWLPEKLAKQLDRFAEVGDDVGVIYCGYLTKFQGTGEILATNIPQIRGQVFGELLNKCFLVSGTPLIRIRCFPEGFFDENLHGCEDWDMWLRISKNYQFDFVPDILAIIYIHGTQNTASLSTMLQGRESFVMKHKDEIIQYPAVYARHMKRLGILYSFAGNKMKASTYFLESLRYAPENYIVYMHLLLSILSTKLHRYILLRSKIIATVNDIQIYY
jgi:glycosyltransferase involved in cell wall biosynthesis